MDPTSGSHSHAPHGSHAPHARALNSSRDESLQGEFHGKMIPSRTPVRRAEYSLVKARLLLLRNASAERPVPPDWHLFFSDACAPLLPCTRVHNFLLRHQGRSFVENRTWAGHHRGEATDAGGRSMQEARRRMRSSNLPLSAYRESHGWVGLWGEHAAALLATEAENEPVFVNTSLADEWYWPTLLRAKGMPTWQRLLTYEEWSHGGGGGGGGGGHPDTFAPRNLSALRARALTHGDFFARKFLPSVAMDDALTRELAKPLPPRNTPGGLASDYAASGLSSLI